MSAIVKLREAINAATQLDENKAVCSLLKYASALKDTSQESVDDARQLVIKSRQNQNIQGSLEAFLQEFGLSNKEGIALMCLAEALLRIPDSQTADTLIAEKIIHGDWQKHLGQSHSLFVNASSWALMLTGKIIRSEEFEHDQDWYSSMLQRLGEPFVRQAMMQAMKILSKQYILGEKVKQALSRGEKEYAPKTRFSFDVLGEGARTSHEAEKYYGAYQHAIEQIAQKNSHDNVQDNHGISIKLSALHPRFDFRQRKRVMNELLPKVQALCYLAHSHNMGVSLDAEESHRLELYLDIFAALCDDTKLKNWRGLGFVLQAYQKRACAVAQWLSALVKEKKRHIFVRLVKGAYWDSEIKYAQEQGFNDYPVFSEKCNTDLSYFCCAHALLHSDNYIYPQFATHNAYTLALVAKLANNTHSHYEFQHLHGMGSLLFTQLPDFYGHAMPPVRVYAPIGKQQDLLPYLVRRLLENGANTSFVNRFLDEQTSADELIKNILQEFQNKQCYRHPKIPKPLDIFRDCDFQRKNSTGIDLSQIHSSQQLENQIEQYQDRIQQASSSPLENNDIAISSPASGEHLGYVSHTNALTACEKLDKAKNAQTKWDNCGGIARAELLETVADKLEQRRHEFIRLISLEAGRTLEDSLNEVREAADFCRYYAQLARRYFHQQTTLCSPTGELNQLSLHGRGAFLCISPWNFPLAIFLGQITAALAAGNSVVAKPAEQTPLIAELACQMIWESGLDKDLLQLVQGSGDIAAHLVATPLIDGVAFTGSTSTAKHIQRSLAARDGPIIPLIAETGGQNAMIVDSSALLEQACDDIIHSAFSSAGQRCSALRILFVQNEIAPKLIDLLYGASEELTLGLPWKLDSDMGPLIDANAKDKILQHIEYLNTFAQTLYRYPIERTPKQGHFLGPHIYEISSLDQIKEEVFGPVLHVIRFAISDLDAIIEQINASTYGLTLGIHTRIEKRAQHIYSKAKVGNIYINRNMIGAVVGVNPFGGWGLSGTGPKAGGPHYLFRFANEKTRTQNLVATGGNTQLLTL